MADINMDRFTANDFSPYEYVNELAMTCYGGEELQQQKNNIVAKAEETASALKKNVYDNHMQFIETATEISHLEAEMNILSQLLGEQRTVLTTLSHISILGHDTTLSRESLDDQHDTEAEKAEEQRKEKLNQISEKVEKCMNLFDIPDRLLLHEGDLSEIDENNTAIQRMHAYLFNDCLMLTSWITNRAWSRASASRYKFVVSYPISSLAVVNVVRDIGNVKQAFKVLAYPDTRVFQCNSFASKKDWLDKFDFVKKMNIEKENSKQKKTQVKPKPDPVHSPSISVEELPSPQETSLPDRIIDVAEELDVLIVERYFKKAYELMTSVQNTLNSEEFKTHHQRVEILKKIEQKQKILVDILVRELDVTHNWSPRGGLRTSRLPVQILNKFNMTSQACELFLSICSQTVQVHVKGVQLEGALDTYVKHVGEVFFCSLSDALSEFIILFPKNKLSAFIVWASTQLRLLMSQLIKQIFTPQCSLEMVSSCVRSLRDQCFLFCEFGLDLRFHLNKCLKTPIANVLEEYKNKTLDLMKHKIAEDKWTPVNMHSKTGISKFLSQMDSMDLMLSNFVINETWVDLSSSVIWFLQSIMTLQKNGLEIVTPETMKALVDSIHDIFSAQLKLFAGIDISYAQKNYKFLVESMLPLMLRHYKSKVGYENIELANLGKKHGFKVAPPRKSVIAKYADNEYL